MTTLRDKTMTLAGLTAASMLLCAPALAGEEHDETHKIFIKDGNAFVTSGSESASFMTTDGDVRAEMVEVRIENDDIMVKLNGEEVPAARIRRLDDKVIVLDSEGNEIKTLNLRIRAGEPREMLFVNERGGPDRDEWLFEGAEEPRAMLGISLAEPGPALLHHLRLEPGTATMVGGVYDGLPGAEAGLEPYDVIVEIDGATPADPKALRSAVAERDAGDRIKLSVIQKGSRRSLTVKLAPFDREALAKHEFKGAGSTILDLDDARFGRLPGLHWDSKGNSKQNRLFFVPDGPNRFHSFEIPKGTFEWKMDKPIGEFDVRVETDTNDADYEAKMRMQIEQLERQLAEMSQMLERMLDEQ